jgi:hypothetical protein
MTISNSERLRMLLGETIADGGKPEDTNFSELEIGQLIEDAGGDLDRAAYEGWRNKAAIYANLVDVTEGNASRAMSDLQGKALDMMKIYARSTAGPTEGRTRIGKIVRRLT